MANFVEQNNLYYLPKFLRFSKGGRISLNFPCLLFPQYYLAYRKMWAAALIVMGIMLLLKIPQSLQQMQILLPDYLPTLRQTGAPAELLQTFQAFSSRLDAHETLLYNCCHDQPVIWRSSSAFCWGFSETAFITALCCEKCTSWYRKMFHRI